MSLFFADKINEARKPTSQINCRLTTFAAKFTIPSAGAVLFDIEGEDHRGKKIVLSFQSSDRPAARYSLMPQNRYPWVGADMRNRPVRMPIGCGNQGRN
jgi:hypothetical protein